MKIRSFILFLMIIASEIVTGQEEKHDRPVTAIVTIHSVQPTGKRHNSYFFTFEVGKVLNGTFNDSIVHCKELYHDFGGGQLLSKLGGKAADFETPIKESRQLVIKFLPDPNNNHVQLIWVAEKERQKRLERLEKLLTSHFKKANEIIPAGQLLHETNGRLFFSIKGTPKVAVETGAGDWVIATVEKD